MKTNQLIQESSNYVLGNTLRVNYSVAEPVSPDNGDFWWEPGSKYPAPWEWESANSIWLSQPVPVFWNQITSTASSNYPMPVEFYGVTNNKIKFTHLDLFVSVTTDNDAANHWGFRTYRMLGTGIYTTLLTWDFTTIGMLANTSKTVTQVVNLYMPGNSWNIAYSPYRPIGAAGNITTSITHWLRFSRP